MADALTGKTEVDATIEDVVASQVQAVLTAEMVVWPTLLDYSGMVRPGMDTLKIPRFGNFTVSTKSENTAVDAQVNAFSTDDLALDQYKAIQFLVEDIANLQARVAIQAYYVEQAAKDLAAEMDSNIITAMNAGVSTSAPDHAIKYNDATNEDLEQVDILEARKLLNDAKYPQVDRYILISPATEKEMLSISDFVKADAYGSAGGLINGEIGRVYGFKVLMSTQLPNSGATTLMYHKSCMAVARQMLPKVEQARDLPNLSDRWSVSHLYGRKVLNSGKGIVQLTETA